MMTVPSLRACLRSGLLLLVPLLLASAWPVAACERHLSAHPAGSDTASQTDRP